MAQEEIEQKVKITYETNAEKTAKKVDKLDNSVKKTTDSQKKSKKSTDSQNKGLESLGGGLGGAISGFKGLIKQAWLLVANPVGLVIAAIALALGGLFKAFTSTKAGAEKFDQIMDGISATIDVARDRILKIAGAIGKFFSGDFAGALADGKAAVSGFGEEVAREFQIAADARKSLQQVADSMRELGVERAKLNRDLVEAKEIIESETASYDEKKEAIERVTKAETEQTEKELANAQKKLDAIRAQNAQSDSSSEALQAEADAETALFAIQQKSAENRIKNIKLSKKADNEEKARLKEITTARKQAAAERAKLDAEKRKEIERIAKLKLSEEERTIRAIQDLNDKTDEEKLARKKSRDEEKIRALEKEGVDVRNLLIYNDELYNALEDELIEKRRIEKKEADAKAAEEALKAKKKQAEGEVSIEQALANQKATIREANLKSLGRGLRLLGDIFGKNKKIQKGILIAENALGIAQTVIKTQASNAIAVAEGAALAIPSAGASVLAASALVTSNNISAGISIASIVAATTKGLSALGGGGSAGSGGTMRGGSSAKPQVGFQASSENQIATTIAENTNEQPPIESFVVESKVTTAQALARKRAENNSF